MIRVILGAYRSAYRGLPRDLWLLALTLVVNRAGSMVLPFLSLYLTQARGYSVVSAGRVLAVYGLGAVAGAYLGGWLSDRFGATRTQQAVLVASGFGYLWLAGAESIHAITVATLVLSAIVESFRPALMADAAERAPEKLRARAFALLRLAANVGMGIGPAVGGYLALVSYRWLFVADAVTCWIAGVLLIVMLEPLSGARDAATGRAEATSPWRDLPFLLLMSLVVVLASAFFQIWSTLPIYFRDGYGLREDTIGLLLALNPLLIALFEMVLIQSVEHRSRTALVGLGAFLTCAGLAMMPLGRSMLFAALTITVWSVGEMLALPLLSAIVADRAGPGNQGRYMGVYTMGFSVAFVFAPAGGSFVYETLGAEWLWYGIGGLGLLLWGWAVSLAGPLSKRGQV